MAVGAAAGSEENWTWSSDVVPTTVEAVVDVSAPLVVDDELPPSSLLLQATIRVLAAISGTTARAARRAVRARRDRGVAGEVTRGGYDPGGKDQVKTQVRGLTALSPAAGRLCAMSAHLVIAEDDRAVRDSVSRALQLEGYQVTAVADGAAALDAASADDVDLLVLDLGMPHVDGLTVCRRLRSAGSRVPILVLTARTEVADRVSGLDAGADDYLPKPFSLDELLARLRALLRRSTFAEEGPAEIRVADLVIDEAARRAWRGQRELELTKTEFDLLQLLAKNADVVLSHATIYDRIWGYDFGPDSKALAVYIGYLRRKTEEGGEARLIQTVRGVGYTLRPS